MLEPLPPDPYKALDISPDAQFDVIKKKYRELVLKCHPDKCPESEKAAATDRFAAVQNAWEILGDATKRQDYHKLVKQHKLADDLSRSTRQAPPPPPPAASRGTASSGYYGTSTNHSSPQGPYGFSSRSGSTKTRYEYDFRYSSEPSFYESDPRSSPHASREPRRPSSWDEGRARETDRSARDRERDRGRGSPPHRDREKEREERDREKARGIKRDDEPRERKVRSKDAKREEKDRIKESEKAAKREEARLQKAKEEEKLRKKAEAKRLKEKARQEEERRQDEERRARKKMEAEIRELPQRTKKVSLEDEGRSKKATVTEEIRSFPEDMLKGDREHERHSERSRDRDSGRPKEERRSSRSETKRQSSNSRRTAYAEDTVPTSRSFDEETLSMTKVLPKKSKNQFDAATQYMMSRGGMPTLPRAHTTWADHDTYGSTDFGTRPAKLTRAATEKVPSTRRSHDPEYDGYGSTSPSRYAEVHGTPFGRAKFGSVDTRNPTTSSWGHVETSRWDTPAEFASYNMPESRSRYRSGTASYY